MGRVHNGTGEFVGVKQAGKDTVAQMLVETLQSRYQCHIISFAAPLKEMTCEAFQLDAQVVEETKERPMENMQGWSYRQLLETIGTDVVRVRIGLPMVWIQNLMRRIRQTNASAATKMAQKVFDLSWTDVLDHPDQSIPRLMNQTPRQLSQLMERAMESDNIPAPLNSLPHLFIVTDVRFPEEYHALKQVNAIMYRVDRLIKDAVPPQIWHRSNRFYPEMIPDHIIINHGSFDDLFQSVQSLNH